jgi:hypothetical protein
MKKTGEILALADSFETTIGMVVSTLGAARLQLEASANTRAAGAEETSNQSTEQIDRLQAQVSEVLSGLRPDDGMPEMQKSRALKPGFF